MREIDPGLHGARPNFIHQLSHHPKEVLGAIGASFLAAAAIASYSSADRASAAEGPVVPPYPAEDEIKYTPEISARECMETAVGTDPSIGIRQNNIRGRKTLKFYIYDQEVDDWAGGRGPGCDYVGKRVLKARVLIGNRKGQLKPAGPYRELARGNEEVERDLRLRVKRQYSCIPGRGKQNTRRVGIQTFERGRYNDNIETNRARFAYKGKGFNDGIRVRVC